MTQTEKALEMRLQVDVSEEMKTWLKVRAARTGITTSEMVSEALEDYRAKVEKKEGKQD